ACENDAIKWDFYVRHYRGADLARVLYPRAGTLGGCTAHNAMIFIYPHNEDWQRIAELTRDDSWRPARMRRYFERLERCAYRPGERIASLFGFNPSRHGFNGWLNVELPCISARTFCEVAGSLWEEIALEVSIDPKRIESLEWLAEAGLDANDWRLVEQNSTGLRSTPLTTRRHRRNGTRERLLAVQERVRDRLHIRLDALATRVLFNDENRATGVEYLDGKGLYRAGKTDGDRGVTHTVKAEREVIVAGGAFNSPQLLMLSGIGPSEHLRERGIDVRVDLPGVGSNLQDRYEIGVVHRMAQPWPFFAGATFAPGDAQFAQWNAADSSGVYTSNGAALSLAKRSSVAQGPPDLFCMLLLSEFSGYYPGFSRNLTRTHDSMTWLVLKAHTRNRAGTVRLRTSDPRDPPEIDFNYFAQGGDEDLKAMVEGVKYVRALSAPLRERSAIVEEVPGPEVASDEQLAEFIRTHAWGHHASCTCAIGDANHGGVLSSDFRVHGVEGLRVVDASAFTQIPGFFIASAVYIIAEKAADVIRDAQRKGGR
ncbi:MAG: GMC oxidoreductase, partial [Candidatus Cybelea sp.]